MCLCVCVCACVGVVAANTIGKVIASTVFMSCLVHVSISDFFTIRKKRIRGGSTYAECNSGAL